MSFLFSDIFAETHQNRSDLSAGSVAFRLQCGAADTGNKTLFICPLHCSFCVGADLRGVGKTGQIVRSGGIAVSYTHLKAAFWTVTDAEVRKRGEQTGLDTLVVHAVNDEH